MLNESKKYMKTHNKIKDLKNLYWNKILTTSLKLCLAQKPETDEILENTDTDFYLSTEVLAFKST